MKRRAKAKRSTAKPSKSGSSKRKTKKASSSKRKVEKANRVFKKKKTKTMSSKSTRSASKSSSTLFVEPMVQVTVKCSNCSREFSFVKLPGLSTEGMICQRCEVGEIQLPE